VLRQTFEESDYKERLQIVSQTFSKTFTSTLVSFKQPPFATLIIAFAVSSAELPIINARPDVKPLSANVD
jgi:hypothetical protein